MNFLARLLLVSLLVVPFSKSYGQIFKSFPKGLGIEIGGGQNNLFWSESIPILTGGAGAVDRTHFSLTPNFRINYSFDLSKNLSAMYFVGYNRIGGNSDKIEGIQSKYYLDVIESGLFCQYDILSFQLGLGLKLNYNLNVDYERHSPNGSIKVDRTEWFTNILSDAGVRATYLILPISVSLESWFGLSDIRNPKILLSNGTIRENHYRLLVGYIF